MTDLEVKQIIDPLNSGGEKPDGVLVLEICKKTGKEYTKVYSRGEGLYEKRHGEFIEIMDAVDSALIYDNE